MEALKLLIIEDNEDDLLLIARALRQGGYEPTWERVQTAKEMKATLASGEWDAILSDHKLPNFSAPAALAVAQQDGRDIPFIVVSGAIGEEVAVGLMKSGAHDYVMKDHLARLPEVVRRERREAEVRAERKRAEEALRASEEKYRILIENAGQGIFVAQDGVIRFANPKAAEISGYSSEELSSRPLFDFVHPEDRALARERHAARLAGESLPASSYRIIHRSGETRWMEISDTLIQWAGKRATLNFASDITERKQAEEALRESQEMAQTLMNATSDAAFLMDLQGTALALNDETAKRLGRPKEELLGKCFFDYLPPEVAELRKAKIAEVARSGQPVRFEDERGGRLVDNSLYPLFDAQGKVARIAAFGRDITEQRRAEKALWRQNQYLAALQETTLDLISQLDLDRLLENVVRRAGQLFDTPSGLLDLYDPQTNRLGTIVGLGNLAESLKYSVAPGEGVVGVVWQTAQPLVKDDYDAWPGRVSDYPRNLLGSVMAAPLFSDGQVIGVLGLAYDKTDARVFGEEDVAVLAQFARFAAIALANARLYAAAQQELAERKRAEEALRLSEERFRAIFEQSSAGVSLTGLDNRLLTVNQALADMLGRSIAELQTISWDSITHPDDQAPTLEARRALVAGECPTYRLEKRYLRPDGRIVWGDLSTALVRDAQGAPLYFISTITDITDRKQAEEALRESEERFRRLADTMPDAVLVGQDGRNVYANLAAARLLRAAGSEELVGLDVFAVIEPAQHERARQQMQRALAGERRPPFEDRFVRRDGSLVLVEITVSLLTWQGRPSLLVVMRDITERKQAEEALHLSEERYRGVTEATVAGITIVDPDENIIFANPAVAQMLGYTLDELVGMNLAQLAPPEEFAKYQEQTEVRKSGANSLYETRVLRKDGKTVDMLVSATPQRAADGRFEGALAVLVDITERKQLEEQLAQSHKLESVGLLAGGVAHDLNNMLVPILGYAEMLRDDMPPTDARRADAQEIVRAGGRARDLVRQLLAFARKQMLEMKLLDLNQVIGDLYNMLRHTLREDIAIETVLAPGLGMVKGDVGQIEQVLMNLCVNAQDAMPQGGTLRVETAAAALDGSREGVAAGDYIQMAVSDSGAGMDQATLSRLFEPFFTTKGVGKGTGLGLATVYGIIKQHSGHIEVESHLGRGSVFRVYWPQAARPVEAAAAAEESRPARGAETILVVEDQNEVRAMTCRMLTHQGYEVLAAESGADALKLAATHPGPIHLLLSDIVMPGMDGRTLYNELAAKRPTLRVLYMSGYSDDVIGHRGVLEPGIAFVQKPFMMQTLTAKVREVLDQPAPAAKSNHAA